MDGPHICSNKAVCWNLWLYRNTYSVCVWMWDVVHRRIKFAVLGIKSGCWGLNITQTVTVFNAEVLQKKSYSVEIFWMVLIIHLLSSHSKIAVGVATLSLFVMEGETWKQFINSAYQIAIDSFGFKHLQQPSLVILSEQILHRNVCQELFVTTKIWKMWISI